MKPVIALANIKDDNIIMTKEEFDKITDIMYQQGYIDGIDHSPNQNNFEICLTNEETYDKLFNGYFNKSICNDIGDYHGR